jgi:hypothetical protein
MCILGLLLGAHPDVKFAVAHSRDEVLSRPAAPPSMLEGEDVIFGRDEREGGTWLGYNRRTGVFVALTNVRRRDIAVAAAAAASASAAGGASAAGSAAAGSDGGSGAGGGAPAPALSPSPRASSRGHLVLALLRGEGTLTFDSVAAAVARAPAGRDAEVGLGAPYGPCNLIVAKLAAPHAESMSISTAGAR